MVDVAMLSMCGPLKKVLLYDLCLELWLLFWCISCWVLTLFFWYLNIYFLWVLGHSYKVCIIQIQGHVIAIVILILNYCIELQIFPKNFESIFYKTVFCVVSRDISCFWPKLGVTITKSLSLPHHYVRHRNHNRCHDRWCI